MKNILVLLMAVLIWSCGASKIEQDVNIVQRPIYDRGQSLEMPIEIMDTPEEQERMLEETDVEILDVEEVAEEGIFDQPVEAAEEVIKEAEDEAKDVLNEATNSVEEATETVIGANLGSIESLGRITGPAQSQRVGKIMKFLASDNLEGRDSGSTGIEMAAQFIETIFKDNDIEPYFDTYRDKLSNFDKPAYNIVGVVEGTDPKLKKEFIVIGAHYDHIGKIAEAGGDAIANGANDNASGTTVVVELARYFSHAKTNKRSIIFALFSAEEKGLLGSEHLAKKLKAANLDLYTMLNYEMVGVPLVGKDYLMYVTGFEESNMAGVANMYVGRNLVGFLPEAKEMNLFKRSDNYPFFKEFGVPSQTFCTFDFTNFDHYHKVGDEISLMDFDHMTNVVNRSIPMIEGITNASNKAIKLN